MVSSIAPGTLTWDVPLNSALNDLQTQITNAARSVNVKAAPYGAVGDGVTDDTAAIQAAINAGGVTYFPPGVYLVSTLEAKLGMVLVGAMRSAYAYPVPATQSSTLKLKSGTNGHLIHAATGINNVQIRDLAFDGNKASNTSGDIIHLDDATAQDTSWHLSDCYLDNSPHDGLFVGSGRQAVKASRCWIMRSANNGVSLNGADGGLQSVLIGLSGANGVYIGAWVQHLTDCDIWSSTANGVLCDNVNMVSLVNCGIDRHQQAGLVVQGGGSASAVGCLFHSNSQSANNSYPHISITAGTVSVIACQFGYDSLANNPSWGIQAGSGTTVLEYGNRIATGSVVQGYVSDRSRVTNNLGGNLYLPQDNQVNSGSSGSSAAFAALRTNATDGILSGRIAADTVNRYGVTAAGVESWGPGGSAAADTTAGRAAAGVWYTSKNALVGASIALGDNGVGEFQLADVTTEPTTNPVAGLVIYSKSSAAVPLRLRDVSGNVRGLVAARRDVALAETNSTVTQQASAYLTVPVEVGGTYKMTGFLVIQSPSGVNFTHSFTGPSGATMTWGDMTATYIPTLTGVDTWSGSGANKAAQITGTLVVGANAGNLVLTFASGTAGQTATLGLGSWLMLDRIK
ncbi:glycosyl hydrolase family 28-related protein [Streptomyces sp. NPDC048281]|uniref:glycosyl hydrolase family 28-related protein n=1 Tax=Streptomyces sp. NPDC048281 TaxID=3154715 RepID=UPI00342F02CB